MTEDQFIYELVKDDMELKRDILHCFAKYALFTNDEIEIVNFRGLISYLARMENASTEEK